MRVHWHFLTRVWRLNNFKNLKQNRKNTMSTIVRNLVKSNFVRTPFGAFNKNHVISITPTDTGVAVFGSDNAMLFWMQESDAKKAQRVSHALSNALIDNTPIDWKSLGYDDTPPK
jgi:hypothetical protein